MRRTLAVSLCLVLSTFACKKKVDAAADAAPEAGDVATDEAGAADAAVAAADEAGAPAASASASATAGHVVAAGAWSGTYHCLGGLRLSQAGAHVAGVATMGKATIATSCSVQGDKCIGTYVSTEAATKKVIANKSLILTRATNGTITFQSGGDAAMTCTK